MLALTLCVQASQGRSKFSYTKACEVCRHQNFLTIDYLDIYYESAYKSQPWG